MYAAAICIEPLAVVERLGKLGAATLVVVVGNVAIGASPHSCLTNSFGDFTFAAGVERRVIIGCIIDVFDDI
jgi:hypothetical protein